MTCPRCRQENLAGSRFCQGCGVRLALGCGSCGATLSAGARFCGACGVKAPEDAAGFASPDAYTPRHLADQILTSRAALQGERKQVTVLFADLKGSMELLAERDPEEAGPLLDPVLEHMMEAVHRYEGTVNQKMSDGIMALFGAPLALEDHAVRACYAALRMQGAVRRYSDELRRSHGVEVQIRVGVNSGEVLVRSIGSDLRMDYTAVGQTTHLAARMQQLAPPASIRITADTLALAEGYVTVTPLGLAPVKGLQAPIDVYELTGAIGAHARFQVSARRGLSRFVGRAQEMEALGAALGEAAGGRGQLVALAGEPGVGKSRLFHEFVQSHRTRGWLVIRAGSVSYGTATPYLPVIDLLKDYLRIDLRLGLRNALFALGQHERVFPHLQAAERLATESGDAGRLARVLRYLSTQFLAGGDYGRAIEFGERAVQTAASTGDLDLEREAQLGLALVHYPRGDCRQACDSLERLAAQLGDEGPRPRLYGIMLFSVATLGFLALPLAERGRFDEALAVAEDALRRAKAHEPRYSLPFAAWSAGYASLRRGDLGPARRMLELAVDRSRAAGLPVVFPVAASTLGLAHALAGRHADAVALLDEAVARAGSGWSHALPFACLAEGYFLAGRADEAGREAERALDLARAKGERGIEAWILRLLGEIGSGGDAPRAAALDAYREALALAAEFDMQPLAALCHLGMGKLHRRIGPPERAREHLDTAVAMLRSMGMRLWLDDAETSPARL